MGNKGVGVTKKTQNRDKTPATLHLRVTNALLYRLSYTGTTAVIIYTISPHDNSCSRRPHVRPSENGVGTPAFKRPVRGIMSACPHSRA